MFVRLKFLDFRFLSLLGEQNGKIWREDLPASRKFINFAAL